MEVHSQTMPDDDSPPKSLQAQLREMYGRLAYTHKAHEKMADSYVTKYRAVKGLEIALSALTSGSLLASLLGNTYAGTVVAAALAAVLTGVLLYFKEGALGESAQKHTEVAAKLWGIRENLLSLMIDMRDGLAADDARKTRDFLNDELKKVYSSAPRTNRKSYGSAQEALKHSEELFFTQSELDHLLPEVLRAERSSQQ